MKPLTVLLTAFILALAVIMLTGNGYQLPLPARIAMAAMLCFTAIGHFAFTRGMIMMIPKFIPFKKLLVYATGLFEILAAIGLLVPTYQYLTGCLLVGFFLLMLPANIYAAINKVDYQKGTFEGRGTNYLLLRIPLQLLFIAWTFFAAVY